MIADRIEKSKQYFLRKEKRMTKHDVLSLLRAAAAPVSGEQMSKALGVSRAAVHKAVGQLRGEGYTIEAATNRGYRLVAEPDRLSGARIGQALAEHPWRERMVVLQSVDSTNNYAKNLAAAGAPEGTCVIAERQTAGRGRRGRSFVSEEGGLYFSCILRPRAAPQQLLHLTALTAVAVSDAIEAVTGMQPQIKWPNDPVLSGKKVCGILTELSVVAESNEAEYVVAGIGINCNQLGFPPELSGIATSLRAETGKPVDRSALAAALARSLERMERALFEEKAAWIARFRERCVTVGKDVVILRGDTSTPAYAAGVGPDAELLVVYPDGTSGAVSSGEVSVRGMYGYAE